jgi:putative hydrolase of the HAD superfamily
MSEGPLNLVIVFDADNTLWDTDSVFSNAQLDLLRVLANAGLIREETAEFDTLRLVDQELIRKLGRFEYDFSALCAAMVHYYSGASNVQQAVDRAVNESQPDPAFSDLIMSAHSAFEAGLQKIPLLFSDTERVLLAIHEYRSIHDAIAVLIFSDGMSERLERILEAHEIRSRRFFDEIIMGRKTLEAFNTTKLTALKYLPQTNTAKTRFLMVGDSLQRDIKLANQAGYITVYKPGGFLGREKPKQPDEEPTFTIQNLAGLIPVLKELGLDIEELADLPERLR